jgi:serine/threonine-protein kinase
MEFLEGRNLNQTVRAEGPFAMERALPVLISACGALDEAHNAGIIHRDLKPENIFLVQSGGLKDFPKLLDFGLAKVGERQMRPGSVILTQEGMVFGTPEFMSPEQAQGKQLTPASDIYSLATILYEVLTGKLPFDAKSAIDYIQLHVTGKPIPLNQRVPGKSFPPLLEQIIDRALAKRPEARYAAASDFGLALQHVLQGATQLPPQLANARAMDPPTAPIAFTPAPSQVTPLPARGTNGQGAPTVPGPQTPMPMTPTPPPVHTAPVIVGKTNVGLLVGVAIAFLIIGVVMALAVAKLVTR